MVLNLNVSPKTGAEVVSPKNCLRIKYNVILGV